MKIQLVTTRMYPPLTIRISVRGVQLPVFPEPRRVIRERHVSIWVDEANRVAEGIAIHIETSD